MCIEVYWHLVVLKASAVLIAGRQAKLPGQLVLKTYKFPWTLSEKCYRRWVKGGEFRGWWWAYGLYFDWFWGNWESTSTFWSEVLSVCGDFCHLERRTGLRILSIILDFVYWLSFFFFPAFSFSEIYFLELRRDLGGSSFIYWQEAGRGHGNEGSLFRDGLSWSCSVNNLELPT